MGRTATGEGRGYVGSFSIGNPRCSGLARDLWFVLRDGLRSPLAHTAELEILQASSPSVDVDINAMNLRVPSAGVPLPTAASLVGRDVVHTLYLQAESAPGVGNGVVRYWIDSSLTIEDTAATIGAEAFRGLSFPNALRAVGRAQSEYFWNIVAWEPGAPTPPPPPALTAIVLKPDSARLTAGASQKFSVDGLLSDGTKDSSVAVTYTATGGSITSDGQYTAGTAAGTFQVVATQATNSLADTAKITIVLPPPSVTAILVTPKSVTLSSGASQQFTTALKKSDGTTSPAPSGSVTYGATGGSITPAGLYTAGASAGSYRVIASYGRTNMSALADTDAVTVTNPSGGGSNLRVPELPRVSVDVSMPTPARSVNVPAGADLQAAINAAQPGDELVLAAGASYTGPFTLPNKGTATDWIVIRSNGALPAPGTRVTPANVGQLATLLSPGSNQAAVQTAPGAHHYRLIGLEIATPTTVTSGSALVALGDGSAAQNTLSQIPHHLILDRVYVHGHSAFSFRRCIALNSGEAAIVDSWISECHGKGFDAQAIAGWNGPGPYRIENNRLEGSGENVMFGGADPSVPNLIPSDIEIRRNHIIKPMSWQGVWTAKNLLELKIGNRVLLEGNVFENSWADAQTGFAIVIWSVNQDGTCSWCGTADVTFRYNVIRNSGSGFQLTDRWNTSSQLLQRVLIAHNTATGIGASGLGGAGRMYQILGGIIDMSLVHNTTVLPGSGMCLMLGSTPPVVLPGLNIQDNVLGGGTAIFSSYGLNTTAITMFSGANSSFLGNAVVGVSTTALPAANTGVTNVTGMGFVQWDTDLHLASTSPLRGTASDKTDPGADITTLLAKTAGVVVP